MIKLTNSLGKKKVQLEPINEQKIGIYVCGVTVYDLCHLGHGRTFVSFDMIVRYLRYRGYEVKYVRNITDIDDKIIKRSQDLNIDWRILTEEMVEEMHKDFTALNILPPDYEPRPSNHIPEIIDMIERLIERQYAYISDDGDVMFITSAAKNYGILSGQKISKLISGARIEINEAKRNPLDFVLWKQSKPGEPAWPSPWGMGRPGWHIECSAMNSHYLGTHFDIHGGGADLIFPHHENEIAQSTAANDGPYVNYWMHTGMVTVDKEKMSKSLNNFLTLRDVLSKYNGETVRFFLLSAHYRKPLNFSDENLMVANSSLRRLYAACRYANNSSTYNVHENEWTIRFMRAMDDDFNTPQALAVIFELAKTVYRSYNENHSETALLANTLVKLGNVLGLLGQNPEHFLQKQIDSESEFITKINLKILEREEARRNLAWSQADRIRDWLEQHGVEIEDDAGKTRWRMKTNI
ncbi:cysteine--tRNA ligase [Pantoea sp. GbtcB22]|uniref:cysteine--tRNA ligase n=1 Tax=Pantoea sp. GbtcB22 TaxID=2824767 RepID=UPI001C301720